MNRRWRPKEWTRPRSQRWRAAHDGMPPVTLTMILNETYSASQVEERRPWWAALSRKHGWMTFRQYYAVKPEKTGRPTRLYRALFGASPLLKMLPKTRSFGE